VLVESAEQVKAFSKRVGYPLVFKPDVGVGAAHTFKVSSDADVDKALAQPLPTAYVAQSFVQGTIVTYDGVVDREGKILFALSHQYSDGVMEVVTERRDISFWSLRQIPEALDTLGRKAVDALGLRERWFHLEFFRLPDERFVALEANLRPPGGFMTDMINYACDIDVYRLWARVVTGDPVGSVRINPKYHVCHIARRAGRPYRHSHEEVVRQLGPALMMYTTDMPSVYQAAMGTEMYLTRHADLERMHEDVRFAQATQ
jgi:biotin carboxylase